MTVHDETHAKTNGEHDFHHGRQEDCRQKLTEFYILLAA